MSVSDPDRWKVSSAQCDYCEEGNVVNDEGYHVIPDPEGIEGDAKIPCPVYLLMNGKIVAF